MPHNRMLQADPVGAQRKAIDNPADTLMMLRGYSDV
jgi:hypothetical protein